MKRSLFAFLIFILAGWILVPTAHAINVNPTADDVGDIVTEKNSQGYMSQEVYVGHLLPVQLAIPTCLIEGCGTRADSIYSYNKSTIATIQNVAVAMYTNPPANLALWYHKTAQDMGFEPKSAYAQGIGFSGLSVLLPIWEGFRNIAYALLAVVMIVIGFMVMFRKKIDPKTVVTVQNALPKIVITLLLITFSYAIVGLMIDLMYFAIALIAQLLIPISQGVLGADTASKYMNGGIWNLAAMVFNGSWASSKDISNLLLGGVGISAIGKIVHVGTNVLIEAIVAIALLIAWIRILFLLVGAYIQILISLFVGPLQILTEAFPGSNGFSSWFKNLFVNIAVFPITAGMLMIGTILAKFNQSGKVWTPPLLSNGGATGWVGVIGLGILFAIPGIAGSLKEAMKAKPAVNAGPGAIFGPIGTGAGQLMQLVYQGSFISSVFMHKPNPSNPLERQRKAGKGGTETILNPSGE